MPTEKLGGPNRQARAQKISRDRRIRLGREELLDALDQKPPQGRTSLMTTHHHHPDIAERVGPDTFLLRGRFVTGDELVADATRAMKRDDLLAQLDRDTGEPLVGLGLHRAALEDLDARGLADSYTDEQYLDACRRAGAR